jgi:NAD(P)-dependent dehydrogenase (short-subunit alcohol dehydrogenase family)
MDRLRGKVAFVTGAGAGIGRAAARLFAREGGGVAIVDIAREEGEHTQHLVQGEGGTAAFFECDVTSDESVRAAIDASVRRFGHLDVLFNCAGGSLPEDSWLTDVDLSVWDRTMTLDLKGTMLCCRHGIPRLIAAGGGAVINMSSGAALRGASPAHIYTAAKGGVVALTRALAGAYAKDNVRVNAICAGRIDTERIRRSYGVPGHPGSVPDRQNAGEQVKRYPFWLGVPEDIANIALFLATDESRMVTGAAIPADGGRSAY